MGLFALPLLVIVYITVDNATETRDKREYRKYKQEQRRRLGA